MFPRRLPSQITHRPQRLGPACYALAVSSGLLPAEEPRSGGVLSLSCSIHFTVMNLNERRARTQRGGALTRLPLFPRKRIDLMISTEMK